jgi:hypothetical protein
METNESKLGRIEVADDGRCRWKEGKSTKVGQEELYDRVEGG